MKSVNDWRFRMQVLFLTLGSSLVLGIPGAGCVGSLARNINLCGTIIDADPLECQIASGTIDIFNPDFFGRFGCPISVNPADCIGVFPPTAAGGGGNGGGAVQQPVVQQPAQQQQQPGFGF